MCPGFIFRFLSPKSSFGVPGTPLSRMFDDSAQILLRHGDVWRRGEQRLIRCFGCTRPPFRRQSPKSFCGAPCGAANRLIRYFGCTRPPFRRQSPKSFCGSLRGGFFQKAPFSRAATAFSFCFFFFCAYLLKRKRKTMKFDVGMERVTLRQGGRI